MKKKDRIKEAMKALLGFLELKNKENHIYIKENDYDRFIKIDMDRHYIYYSYDNIDDNTIINELLDVYLCDYIEDEGPYSLGFFLKDSCDANIENYSEEELSMLIKSNEAYLNAFILAYVADIILTHNFKVTEFDIYFSYTGL